ncbi:cytochrome c3 family protein [Campylobacter pinnipediorum]|uniref:Cytochrome c-type protein n=2 Tax=Campylobacter pinnipediorum TaxID=1965231 RepID=A0A1S6U8N6_9BACT|nr:NapC/NirT family cytochrome c [Campylobacter pinnipediorum]AQW81637.1 NapC/NirT cytochrome c family protein [Campylobacter pinnipediorum subsp. pinnipediorum]AQW83265.1 NapC/NirT cytochrome c family protein [Campylobacter pinnipediorum subsp. pinnipediorum]AQW84833.1 NapC/NirT cytochrome c family protein [Campylobacter pinnipediorum subsp. pinnipediorum]AQW86431.1 NapC/NirT cytochrome c family protein [Campylobacter pinnipediorum subsp. caledonicus]AQW88083.1 NapC/NirT cytochrome c family p
MTKNKKKVFVLSSIIIGIFIGLISSMGIADVLHATGSGYTCTMCHTMDAMNAAYNEDTHGGRNKLGIKAECSACHLDHTSAYTYVLTKIKVSINDGYKTFFTNTDKIDWRKKREHASHFVYDSGCMTCHSNLKNVIQSGKAFLPHRDYFVLGNKNNKTCVECHKNVGHKNLGLQIDKFEKIKLEKQSRKE